MLSAECSAWAPVADDQAAAMMAGADVILRTATTSTHMHVWYSVWMATNLALDGHLLEEALKIGGKTTKKDTVTEALREYIARRKQARIPDLFGTLSYDPAYHYKQQRRRR